jgi:hypothetical protein
MLREAGPALSGGESALAPSRSSSQHVDTFHLHSLTALQPYDYYRS